MQVLRLKSTFTDHIIVLTYPLHFKVSSFIVFGASENFTLTHASKFFKVASRVALYMTVYLHLILVVQFFDKTHGPFKALNLHPLYQVLQSPLAFEI